MPDLMTKGLQSYSLFSVAGSWIVCIATEPNKWERSNCWFMLGEIILARLSECGRGNQICQPAIAKLPRYFCLSLTRAQGHEEQICLLIPWDAPAVTSLGSMYLSHSLLSCWDKIVKSYQDEVASKWTQKEMGRNATSPTLSPLPSPHHAINYYYYYYYSKNEKNICLINRFPLGYCAGFHYNLIGLWMMQQWNNLHLLEAFSVWLVIIFWWPIGSWLTNPLHVVSVCQNFINVVFHHRIIT